MVCTSSGCVSSLRVVYMVACCNRGRTLIMRQGRHRLGYTQIRDMLVFTSDFFIYTTRWHCNKTTNFCGGKDET